MRELTSFERSNIAFLTRYAIDFGLLEPTPTGIRKSILDAVAEYRLFLARQGIHDYSQQCQGQEHAAQIPAALLLPTGDVVVATAKAYRPKTKNGDPRIWFSRLGHYCDAGQILVSVWSEGMVWLLNASTTNFEESIKQKAAFRQILRPLYQEREHVFVELLDKLREIASRGFIRTYKTGSTAVGHLLETELGIKQNSSKDPDYKGVELKSSRALRAPRSNLFAKVPCWELSQVKSFREFAEIYGYHRNGALRLNCTVRGTAWNPQNLRLQVDQKKDLLHEISRNSVLSRPLTWRIDELRENLARKHADTFWIKAESRHEGNYEYIRFVSARQTTKPIVAQFGPMLANGHITIDHMQKLEKGEFKERGPEFKINKHHVNDLFPSPIFHDLLS